MNKSFSEDSLFCRGILRFRSGLINSIAKAMSHAKKFFSAFRNTQLISIIAISAILLNLYLMHITGIVSLPEWIFYRCIIVITFLPWLLCKKDLREIAKGSKLLKFFRTTNE